MSYSRAYTAQADDRRAISTLRLFVSATICALTIVLFPQAAHSSIDRLAQIHHRGKLNCGILPTVQGFALKQEHGGYAGFDIDICRAFAAAILGDAAKVDFVTLTHIEQFNRREDIDVVARRLTWTPKREAATGVIFGPITFYDGQGFLVPTGSGIEQPSQLAGSRVCVINMERHPETLLTYLEHAGHTAELVLVESDAQAETFLRQRRCGSYSADISWLAAARASFPDGVTKYRLLPQLISKEPLAPIVRARDVELLRLVRWTIYALIEAEELGIHSRNADAKGAARARTLLNVHPGGAVALGPGEWLPGILKAVGNYGEIFERNLGQSTRIGMQRGLNRLWSDGGLMYAPPLDR